MSTAPDLPPPVPPAPEVEALDCNCRCAPDSNGRNGCKDVGCSAAQSFAYERLRKNHAALLAAFASVAARADELREAAEKGGHICEDGRITSWPSAVCSRCRATADAVQLNTNRSLSALLERSAARSHNAAVEACAKLIEEAAAGLPMMQAGFRGALQTDMANMAVAIRALRREET